MRTNTSLILRAIVGASAYLGIVATVAAATAAPVGDLANGKKLHGTYCTECHDVTVYTRPNRRVNTLTGLIGQIEACSRLPKDALTPVQVNDITVYLNDTYYRFK